VLGFAERFVLRLVLRLLLKFGFVLRVVVGGVLWEQQSQRSGLSTEC
jgi:hypothetical protein